MKYIAGNEIKSHSDDFKEGIAYRDHKISFVLNRINGKRVLDLGCVMHNPNNMASKYWLHKAIKEKSSELVGLDLYEDGVKRLCESGYNVVHGDAQEFQFEKKFDVIVAADIIEHLHNLEGFFISCRENLCTNGDLLISTPNPWHWRYIVKSLHKQVTVNKEHTCWFCPATLGQLAARFGFRVESVSYGSRYMSDRVMPFPKRIKHTSFHTVLKII